MFKDINHVQPYYIAIRDRCENTSHDSIKLNFITSMSTIHILEAKKYSLET